MSKDFQEQKQLHMIPFTTAESLSKLESQLPYNLANAVGDEVVISLIDFETTGLSVNEGDEPIEIGIVNVMYSPSKRLVTGISDLYSGLEEPTTPITSHITSITGIKQEDVNGKRFDDARIAEMLSKSIIVIAHNAAFDRSFFDYRFPEFNQLVWACSICDVDWAFKGYEHRSLKYLLLVNGFHFNGHRATVDCMAMLQLFKCEPACINEIITAAYTQAFQIRLSGVFKIKDHLKARGYRWNASDKTWALVLSESKLLAEKQFLSGLIGSPMNDLFEFTDDQLVKIERTNRYKSYV